MRALFYAFKIFLKVPKGNNMIRFSLRRGLRCVLIKEDEILAITLSFTALGIDSHRKIDLSKGKWYVFDEILCEVRTML